MSFKLLHDLLCGDVPAINSVVLGILNLEIYRDSEPKVLVVNERRQEKRREENRREPTVKTYRIHVFFIWVPAVSRVTKGIVAAAVEVTHLQDRR